MDVSRDTNFYYSFLVLPAEKRRAIVAVWGFCRAVDDAVDRPTPRDAGGPPSDPTRELARWRAELDRCYGRDTPETVQGIALQPYVERFELPRAPFDDLVDGVAMDVTRRRYETFDELYQYCVRVASAVGLICIEIFGYRNRGPATTPSRSVSRSSSPTSSVTSRPISTAGEFICHWPICGSLA